MDKYLLSQGIFLALYRNNTSHMKKKVTTANLQLLSEKNIPFYLQANKIFFMKEKQSLKYQFHFYHVVMSGTFFFH